VKRQTNNKDENSSLGQNVIISALKALVKKGRLQTTQTHIHRERERGDKI
jgi:hypothetical protein